VTSAGTTTYGWDYENRLTSVTLPGTGGTLAFKYDGLGRRVEKAFTQGSTTTTTNYLYDGVNPVEDVDQNGNVLARYTATQGIDEPLAELRSGTTSYYSQDGLGSVTSLSTSAGALGSTYRYDSFGNLTASSGSITNRFQYTSREFDSETGFYFYRARYYDPTTGRFVSEDPIYFKGGGNFYRYVRNDAVNLIYPTGKSPWGWASDCAAFMYFYVRCADKGKECKLKLLRNAPDAVNPADPGNHDLLGELSNARNGQGTGYEGCMNLAECMGKESVCQSMAKYGVKCGGWAIDMMGDLNPEPPISLSKP
jgi:RHS repeat-associated protein